MLRDFNRDLSNLRQSSLIGCALGACRGLWKCVSPFIEAETLKKVQFVYASNPTQLRSNFDPEVRTRSRSSGIVFFVAVRSRKYVRVGGGFAHRARVHRTLARFWTRMRGLP